MELIIYITIGILFISFLLFNFSFMGTVGKKSIEEVKTTKKLNLKPTTRHPIIDQSICIVCGSCIRACPETKGTDSPLGIVNGVLTLVNPVKCIGHGRCETECPTGAMTVGLGELANDPNMPFLSEENETIIPGIFIAGELSGVPLVKNAIEQGEKVVKTIVQELKEKQWNSAVETNQKIKKATASSKNKPKEIYDIIIIGIGPAGLSATLSAEENKLNYLTIEQGTIGGTVSSYPKQKMVMTEPVKIPLYGILKRKEIQKEELLDIWNGLVKKYNLNIHVGEKVEEVKAGKHGFHVNTSKDQYMAKKVILGIGRRGTPRKLGIEGEDRIKVTYGLIDPDQFSSKNILIVGGGDSAIEAALVLAKKNKVIVSYRQDKFLRIKEKNSVKINKAIKKGEVEVLFSSQTVEIADNHVTMLVNEKRETFDNDHVFILIGGEPAYPLLRAIGVIKK